MVYRGYVPSKYARMTYKEEPRKPYPKAEALKLCKELTGLDLALCVHRALGRIPRSIRISLGSEDLKAYERMTKQAPI